MGPAVVWAVPFVYFFTGKEDTISYFLNFSTLSHLFAQFHLFLCTFTSFWTLFHLFAHFFILYSFFGTLSRLITHFIILSQRSAHFLILSHLYRVSLANAFTVIVNNLTPSLLSIVISHLIIFQNSTLCKKKSELKQFCSKCIFFVAWGDNEDLSIPKNGFPYSKETLFGHACTLLYYFFLFSLSFVLSFFQYFFLSLCR